MGYPKRFIIQEYVSGLIALTPATTACREELNLSEMHLKLDLNTVPPRIIIKAFYLDNSRGSVLSDIFAAFQARGNTRKAGEYEDFKLTKEGFVIDTDPYEIDRKTCVQILDDFLGAFFTGIKTDSHIMQNLRIQLSGYGYSLPELPMQSGLKEGSIFAASGKEVNNEDDLPLYMLVL